MRTTPSPRFLCYGIVTVLFVMDFLLAAFFVVDYQTGNPFKPLTEMLHLNSEGNFPAWYSSAKLLGTGLGLGLVGWLIFAQGQVRGRVCLALLGLAVFFVLLSMDEAIEIHEHLGGLSDRLLPDGSREDTVVVHTGIWMFVVGVPAFAVWLLIAWPLRELHSGFLRRLICGMVVFAFSAFGIELLSNFATEPHHFIAQITLEEWGELTGETLMLWAMLFALCQHLPVMERNER